MNTVVRNFPIFVFPLYGVGVCPRSLWYPRPHHPLLCPCRWLCWWSSWLLPNSWCKLRVRWCHQAGPSPHLTSPHLHARLLGARSVSTEHLREYLNSVLVPAAVISLCSTRQSSRQYRATGNLYQYLFIHIPFLVLIIRLGWPSWPYAFPH